MTKEKTVLANELRNELIEKQSILDQAKKQLKKEFVGIDKVIDEVMSSLSSWYLFPEIHTKPVVLNLWGLTGTGKSSLIKRMVDLIDFNDRYHRFDLGNTNNRFSFQESLEELCSDKENKPTIISLDEFQHAKTISGPFNKEISNDRNRMIWELLDSGKVEYIEYKRGLWQIYDCLEKLTSLLRAGVVVKNGLVVKKKRLYCKEMDVETELKLPFIERSCYEVFIEHAGNKYGFELDQDVEKHLFSLDGEQSLNFLINVIKNAKRPTLKDLSKSLIFVIGNLDEAYTMSDDYSTDLSADEFYEQSLEINMSDIKKALKTRFRNEQIARLGNTHIIYPSFNLASYRKIIELELAKTSRSVFDSQALTLQFHDSLKEIIYKEGVFPTQGTRPVYTTIHSIVNTKLARIFIEKTIKKINSKVVELSFKDGNVIVSYLSNNGEVIHSFSEPQNLQLENLRENKKDDRQAITAVHESGHAICSVFLMNTIPEVIHSVSSEVGSAGFVYTKFKCEYISKKDILNTLAMFLGGHVAEKIVFGDDNVTTGSSSDIEKATNFISRMIKESGMGNLLVSTHIPTTDTNRYHYDTTGDSIKQIEKWITDATLLAEKTLNAQKVLLLKMANVLSDTTIMKKDQIEELSSKHGIGFNHDRIITNGDHLFYRNHLKNQVKDVIDTKKPTINVGYDIVLNKDE